MRRRSIAEFVKFVTEGGDGGSEERIQKESSEEYNKRSLAD